MKIKCLYLHGFFLLYNIVSISIRTHKFYNIHIHYMIL